MSEILLEILRSGGGGGFVIFGGGFVKRGVRPNPPNPLWLRAWSVIVSGVVICQISNVNAVLQYTRISALYNIVIFLAVQNNYLQGQI